MERNHPDAPASRDDGFTLVTSSTKTRRGRRKAKSDAKISNKTFFLPPVQPSLSNSSDSRAFEVGSEPATLEAAWASATLLLRRRVRMSAFFARLVESLTTKRSWTQMKCIGLGSPVYYSPYASVSSFPRPAVLQACVAAELALALKLSATSFDPAHTLEDRAALKELGIESVFMSAKERVSEATLFFMPHVDRFLYDDALRANWEDLSQVAILGNDFEFYKSFKVDDAVSVVSVPFKMLAVNKGDPKDVCESLDRTCVDTAFSDVHLMMFEATTTPCPAAPIVSV